jgi:hypothetical protein
MVMNEHECPLLINLYDFHQYGVLLEIQYVKFIVTPPITLETETNTLFILKS